MKILYKSFDEASLESELLLKFQMCLLRTLQFFNSIFTITPTSTPMQ